MKGKEDILTEDSGRDEKMRRNSAGTEPTGFKCRGNVCVITKMADLRE